MRKVSEKSRLNFNCVMSYRGLVTMFVFVALLVGLLPPARAAGNTTTLEATSPTAAPQQQDDDICSAVVPLQGVVAGNFSDASGWINPEYYSTIQLADVDGDGHDDLVARGSGGILVSHFDKQGGRWSELQQTGLLSDASGGSTEYVYGSMRFGDVDGVKGAELVAINSDGLRTWKYDRNAAQWQQLGQPLTFFDGSWASPQYYSTLRLADINGDGQAELIARGAAGLAEFQWNKGTSNWDTLATSGELSDAAGWTKPQYYETIQFADIDGDQNGQVELIARGTGGLFTFRWDAANRTWNRIAIFGEVSDSQGWDKPQYYRTFRAADIDGDGAAEVIARGAGGVLTFSWDQMNSTWKAIGGVVGWFSDAGGNDKPQYYETIQLADIDGVQGAELIGRAAAGMSVFAWDKQNQVWQQTINPGVGGAAYQVMSNGRGWYTPDKYSTIRYGDIDGDGRAELIGRSVSQIETWRLAPAGNEFVPTLILGFPAFTGAQLTAYQYISGQLLDNAPNADIRNQYTNLNLVQNFGGTYLSTLNSLAAPAGVSAGDFEVVRTQLKTEFGYVVDVNAWFANQSKLITDLNESDILSVSIVAGKLQLSAAQNDESATLSLFSLITNIIGGLASLAGQGEVSAIAGLVSTGLSEAASLTPGGPTIQAQVVELQDKLNTQFQNSVTANGCLLKYHMQDWELLQSLGLPIAQGTYRWDDTLTAQLLTAGRRGYELTLWQTLTPLVWAIDNTNNCTTECSGPGGCVKVCSQIPDGYPQEAIYSDVNFIYLQDSDPTTSPSQAIFDNLLKAPPDGFGVPLEDVFLGGFFGQDNGWNIPGTLSLGEDAAPEVDLFCFRAPAYYLNHLNTLPPGQVYIAGQPDVISISNTARMRLALRGGRTVRQQFNEEFVAAQLSVLAAPGADQQTLRRSRLSSYGLNFAAVQIAGVSISPDSTLDDLLVVSRWAAQYGQRADLEKLAGVLGQLNSDDPSGACGAADSAPAGSGPTQN